jgi:hypothetical protein
LLEVVLLVTGTTVVVVEAVVSFMILLFLYKQGPIP